MVSFRSLCKIWCTCSGLRNRKMGMEKESKIKRFFFAILFACSAVTYLVIGAYHASRAANAARINSDYDDPIVTNAYDACRYPNYILSGS